MTFITETSEVLDEKLCKVLFLTMNIQDATSYSLGKVNLKV